MATGTSSTVSAPAFHADDSEQASDYRSLSVLAIISLIFGIAAPLAFISPLLLAIPFLGIALSLLALRNIAISGGAIAGRWMAIAGLTLCVASAVAPFSRDAVQRFIRSNQAEKAVRHWLGVLTSGQTEEAFRLTVDGLRRQPPQPPPGAASMEPGAPQPKVNPYQTFLELPVVKALKAVGPDANIRLVETTSYQATNYRNVTVKQKFAVSPASAAAGGQPAEVVVTAQRAQLQGESMSRWLIANFEQAAATK